MAQPLRSLPPQIKKAPLVVPSRRVKFVRVEVIKASLLIRTTTVHYIIGAAWSNVRSLWVISGHCTPPDGYTGSTKAGWHCTEPAAAVRRCSRQSRTIYVARLAAVALITQGGDLRAVRAQ